ncbi:hypothetical protein PIB30_039312 [Stylosanthes scabra]|nr:hypothetical protein [Stylosanthes scabra]
MEFFVEKAANKAAEVERMRFGFLKHIAKWTVNQKMYVALAKDYDRESRSLRLGTRRIPFNVETVSKCFGLPNHGDSIKKPKTPKELELCDSLMNKTQAMPTQDVMVCPMNTADEVINFRRLFILLVCKCFFFPSSRATVSQFHTI